MMYARSVTDKVSRTLWSVINTPIPLFFNPKMISWRSSTAIGSIPENGSPATKKNSPVPHAPPTLFQSEDDLLEVEHRDRIDTRERLVQQNKCRLDRQAPRNLHSPAFP